MWERWHSSGTDAPGVAEYSRENAELVIDQKKASSHTEYEGIVDTIVQLFSPLHLWLNRIRPARKFI